MKISRRRARIAAFGAVFAVLSESGKSAAVMVQKRREAEADKAEAAVLNDDLTIGIAASFDGRRGEIEDLLADAVRRPPELISTAERAIICAAAAELLAYPATAHKIIINEAIDIAKQYGSESGYKLVNAALDNICRTIRN
ncbi:MAG: transcription antitermination factor NusB [Gammaproteobacteria bacterium]